MTNETVGNIISNNSEDSEIIVEEISYSDKKECYMGNVAAYVRIHTKDGTIDFEAALYDSIFDYACDASVEHYTGPIGTEEDPEYKVEEFQIDDDPNLRIGRDEAGEIEFNGTTYVAINWEENEESYIVDDGCVHDSLYAIIRKGEKQCDGTYEYVFTDMIFETEEDAQAKADELNRPEIFEYETTFDCGGLQITFKYRDDGDGNNPEYLVNDGFTGLIPQDNWVPHYQGSLDNDYDQNEARYDKIVYHVENIPELADYIVNHDGEVIEVDDVKGDD